MPDYRTIGVAGGVAKVFLPLASLVRDRRLRHQRHHKPIEVSGLWLSCLRHWESRRFRKELSKSVMARMRRNQLARLTEPVYGDGSNRYFAVSANGGGSPA